MDEVVGGGAGEEEVTAGDAVVDAVEDAAEAGVEEDADGEETAVVAEEEEVGEEAVVASVVVDRPTGLKTPGRLSRSLSSARPRGRPSTRRFARSSTATSRPRPRRSLEATRRAPRTMVSRSSSSGLAASVEARTAGEVPRAVTFEAAVRRGSRSLSDYSLP